MKLTARESAASVDQDILDWRGFRARYVRPLLTPWRLSVGLTLLFFVSAVLVYYFTSPGETPANQPVRLADALLHGRLDIADGPNLGYMDWAIYKGKYYPVSPPMPAWVLLPGVILYGLALNQTLVSIVIGGITAGSVYALIRRLTERISVQVWLTLLFAFGTIFFYYTVTGYVTHFASALSVLFLFLAIYATLVSKQPFLAGLLLGAAYWTRFPAIMALPFFVIMFADQWLPQSKEKSLLRRINLGPLLQLASGLGIFLVLSFIYNYLQFETVLPASASLYNAGVFDPPPQLFAISHITPHLPVFFGGLPIFQAGAPYVVPSYAGMAIWATTPVFLYALFAGIRNKLVIAFGSALIVVTLIFFVLTARGVESLLPEPLRFLGLGYRYGLPLGLQYFPFLLLIGYGLFAAIRSGNRLVVACWAAIIPIALVHLTYFFWPPQFGIRYALDYYPFLFLLTWVAIGDKIKWHHMVLITLAIAINLGGVLWVHQFGVNGFLGLTWVRF